MVENTTYTWVTVPVAELCLNHCGRRLRYAQQGVSIEGVLAAFAILSHDEHHHMTVFVRTGEGGTQVEFDGTETVSLTLEKS